MTGGGQFGIWNLGRPRLSYKKAGAYDLAAFTIAVSHGRDRTSFVDCQVWGKRWELIVEAYKKGCLVAISGDAEYTTYETEDGQKRKQLRVNVNNFVFPEKRESAKVEETAIPF